MRSKSAWIACISAVLLCLFLMRLFPGKDSPLPLLIPGEDSPLNTFASLLAGITSVVTMFLAFVLSGRFGVQQQMLERQFGAVEKLLGDMTQVWFAFLAPSDPKNPALVTRVRIYAIMPAARPDPFPEASLPIFLTGELERRLDTLARHSGNVFLPMAIAEPLRRLHLGWIDSSRVEPEPAHLRLCDENMKVDPTDYPKGFKVRGEFMLTPNKLEAMLRAVIDAINKWHREHAGPERALNLPGNRQTNAR